jgi:hypothetical protein
MKFFCWIFNPGFEEIFPSVNPQEDGLNYELFSPGHTQYLLNPYATSRMVQESCVKGYGKSKAVMFLCLIN